MKLHLPTRLRAAVLACVTAVAALATTVGTGALTTGVVAYTMVASQAAAAYHADTHTFDGADNANFGTNLSSSPADIVFNMENTGTSNWSNSFTYAGAVLIGADGATETGLCLNNGNSGQVLTLSGKVTGTGLISKKGAGVNNTLALTGDVTEFTGNYVLDSTVAFTLRFGSGAAAPATTAEVGVGGTGSVTFKTDNNTLAYNYGSGSTVHVTNAIVREGTVTSKVSFSGGANYSVHKDADISELTVNGGIVTFSGSTVLGNVTGNATGVLGNSGALTLNGTISLYSAIMNGGSVTLGNNVKFDISHLTAEEGVYTIFDGTTVDLSGLSVETNLIGKQAGYAYTFGENGTVTAVLTSVDLVWNGGASGVWNADNTNWLSSGEAAAFHEMDSAVFNTAGAEVTIAGDKSALGISINADTSWLGNATVTTKTLSGTGTLNLASDTKLVVTQSVSDVTLAGSGTMTLKTGNITMGATLASDWTGKVVLGSVDSGRVTTEDLALNQYGNANSSVELKGIYGRLKAGGETVAPNLVISNTADGSNAGLEIYQGYSNATYTFNGSISGTGNVVVNFSGTQRYVFNGDMTEWTGNLNQAAGTLNLTFNDTIGHTSLNLLRLGGAAATIGGTGAVSVKNLTMAGSNVNLNTDMTVLNSFAAAEGGSSEGKSLTIADGKSLTAGSLVNQWGMTMNLGTGSSLTVTGVAAFTPGGTQRTWSGAGADSSVISVGGLTNANHGNTIFSGLTLHVGASGISQNAQANRFVLGGITLVADASFSATSANQSSGRLELTDAVTLETGEYNVTIGSQMTGSGSLTKNGTGTLTLNGTNDFSGGLTIAGGEVVAGGASALGSGAVTVESGSTLQLKSGDVLVADQTVTNAGTVVLHDTVTIGAIVNNGSLEIASGFSGLESAGIKGIEGVSAAGNGFAMGGTATIFTPATASITGTLSATFAGTPVEIDAATGTATLGDDWGTYHITTAPATPETFGAISAAATAQGATLESIEIVPANTILTVDADGLATSMLTGDGAATATLAVETGKTVMVDTATMPAMTAADNAEITLNMGDSAGLNLTGASTLHVTGTEKSNTLNLGTATMARELTITNATVTSGHSGGTGFNTGTTSIGAGGTLSLTAGNDALGWDDGAAGAITLLGEAENLAVMELGGRATMTTNIVMQGNSIIKSTASPAGTAQNVPALDPKGGSITVSGTNNEIAINIRQRDALTITVAEDSDLTVTGSITRTGNAGRITKEGAGMITFASSTSDTLSGYKHKAGSTVFSGMTGLVFDQEIDASGSKSAAGTISFVNGAEATLNANLWLCAGTSILVDDASTFTKHTNSCDLSITAVKDQTATMAGTDEDDYVDIDNGGVTISNAVATVTAANAVEVALSFASTSSVTNAGAGALTLTNTAVTSLAGVNAQGGDITLGAATSIGSLTIAGGKTVTASAEGPLSITTALTAGAGSTLASALSIGNGATLDLVTGDNALSLGSQAVTLGTGLTITEAMMTAITSLEAEASLTLMKGVSSLTGGDMDATDVFTGLTGDYTIKVQDGNLVVSAAALPSAELTWLGGNGTWGGESTPWTSAGGDSAYVPGANVTIGGEGGATGGTITVSGEQTAKAVTIVESGYSIQRADSGTNSLTIQGALTVAEGVSFSSTFLPTVGSIVLNAGSELFFNNAQYVNINGNMKNILGKVTEGSTGTLKMTGGTSIAEGNRLLLGGQDLTISGVSVHVTDSMAVNTHQGAASLIVNSALTVDGELRMESLSKLDIQNGAEVTLGTLTLGHAQAGHPGHLAMAEGGSLTVGTIQLLDNTTQNTMNVNGGTLTITGESAFTGTGTATTVNVGAATITNGEKDMAFNHASTLTGTTISAQNNKTITVGGSDLTTTLAGAITTEGKVTLAGTLDTTGLTALNNSGALTITGDTVEMKGSVLNNTGTLATTGALTLTDAATVGGTVNAGSLSLTGANTFTAVTTGALTIADSLNVTGALTATSVTITNVSLTTTALTAGSFAGDSLALTVDENAIATAMGTSATTLTLANITGLTAATINGDSSFTVGSREYTIGVEEGIVTITSEISDQVIWKGSEGDVWGDGDSWETGTQPDASSNVVFNGDGVADVIVGSGAQAGAIFVETDTNFIPQTTGNVATGGVEVSAGTLTIDEDVTVVATGTTSVVNETGNLIIKGALQTNTLAATGKDVQLSGTLTVDTEGSVNSIGGIDSDYGKLIVGTDAELTLLDVVEEKLTIATDSTVGDLEVKHTGNLDAKGTFTVNNKADVAAGGVMTVAKNLTISDDLTNAGNITVGSAAAPATLSTEDVTNNGTITVYNTMTSTGNVSNKADATLDVKGNLTANTAGKTVTNDGTLTVGGTANVTALTTTDGSTTTVKGNTTIAGALNNGGTLTVGTQAAPATLATGDVVNNGSITVYNTMTSTGDVTNNAGKTLDVKGNLTANTEGKTVTNEGTMTIGGTADVATLTTGDAATTGITGNATVATALTNEGSTTIGGALTATNATVTNEATGAGEKLTVTGALTADTLTTAAGATTEAKGGATLGTSLDNHGTTTVTGDLASADATAPITITNDAAGVGEKLTVTGNVTAKSLTTETGATTELTGSGKKVKLTDSLTNKGTTTIKGDLVSADATATTPGSLAVSNTGTLSTGNLKAESLSGNGATTVKGNATVTKLDLGTTGSLTATGTVKTNNVSSTGGSLTADTLDLRGLTDAATFADIKADKITLSGFNMLKVTDSISNETGTDKAKVSLTLDAATMSTLSVGDQMVVVATDGAVSGQGITLDNIASVNSALKAYGIKGAMLTNAAGELVMMVEDNSFRAQIATSENGKAGAEMLDEASAAGYAAEGTALGDIYAALDACRDSGNTAEGDRIASALTGSSIAAMGSALSGDVERQLRAIRNRTTTMGVNQGVINEDLPYFNAWVNAEGDYRKVAADGTMAGYKMTSWGGTVGMDVDVTPRFTCGLAATAMYGDFDADSSESASGDIDTYYVSAFARYAKHRWTHTFVATVGLAETSLERTIQGHTVKGDSDGMMFGGMYEVGYVFALDKNATTCLQPVLNVSYTHATLNGYTESGANMALTAGDTEFNKLTVGAGARLQSVVGENIYNRSSILEARALVKFDAGDRQGETDVAFAGFGSMHRTTKSSETGAIGAEIGVGLTVPVGSEGGSIFADASAEIRAEYTNVNATVGYRVNF